MAVPAHPPRTSQSRTYPHVKELRRKVRQAVRCLPQITPAMGSIAKGPADPRDLLPVALYGALGALCRQ
jgi:hypothetical protein